MKQEQFINIVLATAIKHGYTLEDGRNGVRQIDFGNKKLHENHFKALYPAILKHNAHIPTLINNIAPGRPCVHKPMREIIADISNNQFT